MTRSLEEIQWRNIHKVVNALADLCFGGPKDPQYGIMHLAITTSLTAKDGLDTSNLGLEPLVVSTPEVVQQVPQSEDSFGYGAQLLEENGRKVLSYWPHCSECRKPFEFEKDEPFASCGCAGSTEWGDPRPASWVQPPAATKAIQELGAATLGK